MSLLPRCKLVYLILSLACTVAFLSWLAWHGLAAATAGLPRDVVAVVVKDEADLLPYWLAWHTAIFGVGNVIVVDQESSSPAALHTLREFERAGGSIVWRAAEYARKGEHTMSALALARQRSSAPVRLFFPLDVDEFLIAADASDPSRLHFTASAVRCAIQALLPTATPRMTYHTRYCSSIITVLNGSLATTTAFVNGDMGERWMKKFFLATSWLWSLDHGNHWGSVLGDALWPQPPTVAPTLRLLHYHATSPQAVADKARDDVQGFGYNRRPLPCAQKLWWWPFTWEHSLCYTGEIVPDEMLDMHLEGLPPGTPGLHKVGNLLNYRKHGVGAFVQAESNVQFRLPPIDVMLEGWVKKGPESGCKETAN